jgi:hypothetical protein
MFGRVYVMRSVVTGLPYIGSTILTLRNRMRLHHSKARRGRNSTIYKAMRSCAFTIELLEVFEHTHRDQLRRRENQYIVLYDSIARGYNTYRAFTKDAQHAERDRVYNKEYYSKNRAAIKTHMSQKVQCPTCGTHGWRSSVARHERTAMHIRLTVL